MPTILGSELMVAPQYRGKVLPKETISGVGTARPVPPSSGKIIVETNENREKKRKTTCCGLSTVSEKRSETPAEYKAHQ